MLRSITIACLVGVASVSLVGCEQPKPNEIPFRTPKMEPYNFGSPVPLKSIAQLKDENKRYAKCTANKGGASCTKIFDEPTWSTDKPPYTP